MASLFKHKRTTLERAEKYISQCEWTDCNLTSRLYPIRHPVTQLSCYSPPFAPVTLHPELKRIEFTDAVKGKYESATLGQSFGPTWATHWFRLEINILEGWIGKEVHLCWDCGCESLVWSEDGQPLSGLSSQVEKVAYILTRKLTNQLLRHVLYIEIACNEMFGASSTGLVGPTDPNLHFTLKVADIAIFDRQVNSALQDLRCLTGIAKHLSEENPRSYQALYAANQIINAIQVDSNYEEAAKIANNFFSERNGVSQHTIIAVGNCHIDCAWLWPYGETIRKCARSLSSTLALMEEYPDFIFAFSQAQQFSWVKKYYPKLFEKVRHFVTKGQFVCVGGTWVEMDGNIPRHCGIERFLSQKMSWNLVNPFPHQNFLWEGLDGTVIVTHFPPGESYEMKMEVAELVKTVSNLKDKGRVSHSMLLYGHGDGGGGPTEDMLERAQRLRDVDGIPKVQFDKPSKFFTELERCTSNLCRWVGELYLELHNGTYTTQASIKKSNRRGEFAFRDIEFLASLLLSYTRQESDYPSEALEEMWHTLLLNQFHDVLPGTIIHAAVEEVNEMYASLHKKQLQLQTAILDKLFGSSKSDELANSIIINTLSWPRTEVLNLPNNTTAVVNAAAMSACRLQPVSEYPPVSLERTGNLFVLKNSFIQATVNHCGHVVSLKLPTSQIDFIASGRAANQLVIFDDVPLFWDAWDVMDYHLETRRVQDKITTPMKILMVNPMRVILQCKLSIGVQSELCLKIIMDACKPYLLFDVTVDWKENHKFLKVEFPANVLAHEATYEIQYGHLTRPTHRNTSWDAARFEVCGHKWADISEHDFGLSILNDSKYGYSALGNVLSLSLLRSPKRPDESADMGTHSFSYAVMPHFGTFQSAGVIERAHELNCPLIHHHTDLDRTPVMDLSTPQSWFWVDADGVIISAVKKAEKCAQEIIVRIYEAYGRKIQAKLSSTLAVRSVVACSGLEDVLSEPMLWLDGGVILDLTPFQIMSIILYI